MTVAPSPSVRLFCARVLLANGLACSFALAQPKNGGAAGDVPVRAQSTSPEPPKVGDLPPPDPPRPLGEALTGEPKRNYDAAVLLYKSGDFAGAAARFASAYQESKDVRLLWNAAACEQALRHYAKAIVLVRRYLDSRSPLITAEAERNALAFLNAAIPLTARLIVDATEPDIRAFVDDELVGTLPLEAETRVDFGTHRLTLRKAEFVDHTQTFTVTSPADVRIAVKLIPVVHQGRLVVRAGRDDSIALDGRFVGLSSFDGVVPSGKHTLRVTASGSRPFETQIVIEDDRTRAMDVALEAAPLTSSVPTWAWIAGGAVLVAGAGTVAYFALRSPDSPGEPMPAGSAGKVQLPLR